jgi:signal transduction histidine kinase
MKTLFPLWISPSVFGGVLRAFIFTLLLFPMMLERGLGQASEPQEKGLYFHQQYMAEEYGGHSQNWALTEDNNGLLYVGNNNGLLEYDGVEWRVIEVAGGQVALSLALSKENQLFVGSVNDFGVIKADTLGRSVYHSMANDVPEAYQEFEDVWETLTYSGGVLFRTRSAVFHFDKNDSLTIIEPEERFERMHKVGDELYIVDLGTGLMKFDDMKFQVVPGGSRFDGHSVWYMAGRPDGSIFIATRDGTFLFDGESVQPFETEIAAVLSSQNVYYGTEIEGRGYAFATISGGVYITNYSGDIIEVFDERILTSTQATYVYTDRFNNLWVATTSGFNRVEISNPLTYFDKSTGLTESITDLVSHNGKIFVTSASNIQYLSGSTSESSYSEFQDIPVSSSGYHKFVSTDNGLLVTSGFGMLEVSEDGLTNILPEFEGIGISQSAYNPDHVLFGHRDGIAIFRFENEEWKLLREVEGVNEQVYTLEQEKNGVIWAGTEFQGLIRIAPGDESRIDRFDSELHFNSGSAQVYLVNDEIIISTATGIYKPSVPWNPDKPFSPDITDLMEENQHLTGTSQITEDSDGKYWVVTDSSPGVTETLENPLQSLKEGALARISSAVVKAIFPDPDGIVWVANENRIVRYDTGSDYPEGLSFDAFIRKVTFKDELLFGGSLASGLKHLELPYQNNDLRFRFGTNFYEDEARTQYQVKLTGFDDTWTNWSSETFKDYTNIPHGSYDLELRAKNIYGKISSAGVFSFTILPPWWFSWWAYVAYLLLLVGVIAVVDRFQRKRIYKKERERAREKELEQAREIEKAYENLKAAQDQLVQQEKLASLGQLTAGIAHEIKNPLNFVNNFSEVSIEMIDEVREELNKMTEDGGQKTEILAILNDIEANLRKIHEHGFRADSIVKSMLQHSRGGSGKMEPTDLNALVKEYVNLAFHGMRAGKDPINVDIKMDLDDSIGDVPMISEDFSRVILNLVNNAFDACAERSRSTMRDVETQDLASLPKGKKSDYKATLTIRTKSENGKVFVEIEDNGPGIPDDIKDNILQPFFTTKKGTSGTGLGLSITNDIVKAHGGSIGVHSEPGQTVFTIKLNG